MIARAIERNIFGVLDLMNNCLWMSNIYFDFCASSKAQNVNKGANINNKFSQFKDPSTAILTKVLTEMGMACWCVAASEAVIDGLLVCCYWLAGVLPQSKRL